MHRYLLKFGRYFVKWTFKARNCALESHKHAVFRRCEGCSLKKFFGGKPLNPNLSHFTRCSETLKPLLKPPCASWCVHASYVFISKYLSGASLIFLQRDRGNAVL